MSETGAGQVTLLLNRWQCGDKEALDELIPLVYQELRRLANAQIQRGDNHSIQCTELLSEAYLRLIDANNISLQNRNHFFSIAAKTMRRVLVDNFRRKNAGKRGQNQTLLTFKDGISAPQPETVALDQLEEALVELENKDPRQADIVTLKFFGGLNMDEIAGALSISRKTVSRDWAFAKLWLFRELESKH